jgi:hypothetical protein
MLSPLGKRRRGLRGPTKFARVVVWESLRRHGGRQSCCASNPGKGPETASLVLEGGWKISKVLNAFANGGGGRAPVAPRIEAQADSAQLPEATAGARDRGKPETRRTQNRLTLGGRQHGVCAQPRASLVQRKGALGPELLHSGKRRV